MSRPILVLVLGREKTEVVDEESTPDGSARPVNGYNICQQSYQKWKTWGNARSTAELPRVLSVNLSARIYCMELHASRFAQTAEKVYAVNGCALSSLRN